MVAVVRLKVYVVVAAEAAALDVLSVTLRAVIWAADTRGDTNKICNKANSKTAITARLTER